MQWIIVLPQWTTVKTEEAVTVLRTARACEAGAAACSDVFAVLRETLQQILWNAIRNAKQRWGLLSTACDEPWLSKHRNNQEQSRRSNGATGAQASPASRGHGTAPARCSSAQPHPELAAGPGELSHSRVLSGCPQEHGPDAWPGEACCCGLRGPGEASACQASLSPGRGALAAGRRCLALHFNAASILRDLPSPFPAHADTSSLNLRLASPQDTHG